MDLHGERLSGIALTPIGTLYLETLITPRYVHTLAATSSHLPRQSVFWSVEGLRSPANQSPPAAESLSVRTMAIRRLARQLHGRPKDFEIRRDKWQRGLGPPYVCYRNERADIDISLSHDGNFAAYALLLPS